LLMRTIIGKTSLASSLLFKNVLVHICSVSICSRFEDSQKTTHGAIRIFFSPSANVSPVFL
jgi:hypothetical protein